ncbi:hypothetical protein KTD28_00560 [Burkholderia gladioli]|uniref:HEPN domain-containing protein n=1 Tax=Burkholderia gladioli TaxID=28095 RepID=UPI00163F2F0F|nr:HEPN domain-containing protein [Burkholderia gladioli]MBU9153094.1 hypothetical protein [Burkholderia gladioli]MDR8087762.1 hypothetical protein [Burkholderia gladioli]
MSDHFPEMWAFILNPFTLPEGEPFEIFPGMYLRRANDVERTVIKKALDLGIPDPWGRSKSTVYDTKKVKLEPTTEGTSTWTRVPVEHDEYRYNIVAIDELNYHTDEGANRLAAQRNDIIILAHAANACDCPLKITAFAFSGDKQTTYRPKAIPSFFTDRFWDEQKNPSIDQIEQIKNTFIEFKKYWMSGEKYTEFPEVSRAYSMYDILDLLHENSEFEVLGLFAIIEMLITHNPLGKDIGDSITHQMQTKLPLLMNRFEIPIDHQQFFGNVTQKKIWDALYSYRSAVAHGGEADFEGRLRIIKDQKTAIEYLHIVVKALLRHVLKEPLLFRDLKAV